MTPLPTSAPTLCPFAVEDLISVNYGGDMLTNKGLVVHVQEGDYSLFEWFDDPAAQVSSHFWISKSGRLEQYVLVGREAWAQVLGNASYVSVETEGYTTEPLTYAQQGTLASLIAWGHMAYGWPLQLVDHGGEGITTHAHYPSELPDPAWGDHACPGHLRSLQLPKVLDAARAIARPI